MLNSSQQVLADAGLSEDDSKIVGMYANFLMNTSPGWRPSDCMRRAVREFKENPEAVRNRKSGHSIDGVKPF